MTFNASILGKWFYCVLLLSQDETSLLPQTAFVRVANSADS